MIEEIRQFQTGDFYTALQNLFKTLNVPVNYITKEPAAPGDILGELYKPDRSTCKLMDDVYFLGMIDDAAFEYAKSLDPAKIESDYDGILIFGVTLHPRENGLLPTRGQLAEITRSFNRKFHYTPVVVVFKYGNHIAFANAERLKYKQEWREGEKAGKISLLRNIDIKTPHSGHMRILLGLVIKTTGPKAIKTFAGLYSYWQEVFNVSLLNKKFYEELANWYFWAVKEVTFPSEPTIHSLFEETGSSDDKKLAEAIQEHKAKNVIRLLTRFLFVWFIKEKKLIPEKLFEREYLEKELLNDLSPFHDSGPQGNLFQDKAANIQSHYYKAILQNLFFATLNQEMGKRGFRRGGQNMNVTNLLRYKPCFKDTQKFVDLVESVVPFMNGGLFECLDKPHPTKKGPKGGDVIIYKDGFSDRKDIPLKVPDYLFFGLDEEVDLSSVIGIKNKKTKQAAVKGLINIFNSYKFTIAENTPIEEDIALDPELLGKVFENLLASYNPETKTTARKQTGSFYTPREIVNYMVDESLIAYLKNAVTTWDMAEEELDAKLHQLLSFDLANPFADNLNLQKEIIKALDHCTILDPACGSGAFPMGILQKMVHVLHKIDPQNIEWKQRQISRVDKAITNLEEIDDPNFRQKSIKELETQKKDIEDAFADNELDYGRKLFLIENCIYGVDIQPIAVQISKLRFFISLVVDQKVNKDKVNFGILPLPNLETKFVAANTLIGIEKQGALGSAEIKRMEQELKKVRHRIFSAKTPKTKRKLREKDLILRKQMGGQLIQEGWPNETAQQLAGWDPYDQNAFSGFFDTEWMFGVQDGFDVVIGNPPYMRIQGIQKNDPAQAKYYKETFATATGRFDLYVLFTEKGIHLLKPQGVLNYIMPHKWTNSAFGKGLRNFSARTKNIYKLISFKEYQVFNASTYTSLVWFHKRNNSNLYYLELDRDLKDNNKLNSWLNSIKSSSFAAVSISNLTDGIWSLTNKTTNNILIELNKQPSTLKNVFKYISTGIQSGGDDIFLVKGVIKGDKLFCYSKRLKKDIIIESKIVKPLLMGDDVKKYCTLTTKNYVIYPHSDIDGKTAPFGENYFKNNFPLTYSYLVKFKDELVTRKIKYKTNPKFWYALHRSREVSMFEQNKIITPEISLGTNMTYDCENLYHNTKCYSFVKNSNIQETYKFWLAILNSSLMWFFLVSTGYVLRGGFFTFKTKYLESFPLPKLTSLNSQKPFVTLVDCMLHAKAKYYGTEMSIYEQIIDGMVFQLYFPDHMQEKQIDILQFVEEDLAEVMQNEDFDVLPDNEKEEIIKELHARWTHPDSEVRNRIKLFAVRSPDILKPILESS